MQQGLRGVKVTQCHMEGCPTVEHRLATSPHQLMGMGTPCSEGPLTKRTKQVKFLRQRQVARAQYGVEREKKGK